MKLKKEVKKSIQKKSKKAVVKKKKSKLYSLLGELTITTSACPPIAGGKRNEVFESKTMVLDSLGNMFMPTTLDITVDGHKKIVMLDAKQVELLLKLLRIADYEHTKGDI